MPAQSSWRFSEIRHIPAGSIIYLSLSVRHRACGAVADVTGDIDFNSGPWLAERLLRMLRTRGTRVLVDLSGVTFIDCSGLRKLLAACKSPSRPGGGRRSR
jgi:anti-anti-sigma factor